MAQNAKIPMKKVSKIYEASGTTTANGNVSLGVNVSDGVVTAAWSTSGIYTCLPYAQNGTAWYAHVRSATANSQVVASTAVTINYTMM